jgi:hypothetical protein
VFVTDTNGNAIPGGNVTIHDGSRSKTVGVSGGNAQATFTFPLLKEIPNAHGVSAHFSDNSGLFASGDGSGTAASTLFQWEYQWLILLMFLDNLTSGG